MKEKYVGAFWGMVMILAGVWFLATGQMGFLIQDPIQGMALNGGLSLLFFISYFLSGPKRWGWLFPACIFAGSTLTILFATQFPGPEGGWVAAPVLLSIAVPFLVAYFQEPQTRRWALIPTYAMVVLTLVASFAGRMQGEFVGTLVLMAIALPFLVVYLLNREHRWALIPFGILAGISLIPALAAFLRGEAMGVAVMLVFAIPFAIVYMMSPRNWWALIPAGIFATIGVVVLLVLTQEERGSAVVERLAGGTIFLGWALTFLGVWLRRFTAPTAWAIYPALGFGVLAVGAYVFGQQGLNMIWPLVLIGGGIWMLYHNRRRLA